MSGRERAFVAFLAPRGVVAASVAALAASGLADAAEEAAAKGVDNPALVSAAAQAEHVRTIMMLVILVTVAVSASAGLRFARWLEVDNPVPADEGV